MAPFLVACSEWTIVLTESQRQWKDIKAKYVQAGGAGEDDDE